MKTLTSEMVANWKLEFATSLVPIPETLTLLSPLGGTRDRQAHYQLVLLLTSSSPCVCVCVSEKGDSEPLPLHV